MINEQFGKEFSRTNMQNMIKLYNSDLTGQSLTGQLSWTHLCELLSISNDEKRKFYEKECINSNWSVRELKY